MIVPWLLFVGISSAKLYSVFSKFINKYYAVFMGVIVVFIGAFIFNSKDSLVCK